MSSDEFEIRNIDPVEDAELVRRVYARSWPTTCHNDYSADEIIERLGNRDLLWWQKKLSKSPIRFTGTTASGRAGFALAAPEGDGWDFSYLFCEPEAFGSGLAAALHDAVVEALGGVTDVVGGWVLAGNERSQRFLTSRGWANYGIQTPPWPEASARFVRFERKIGVDQGREDLRGAPRGLENGEPSEVVEVKTRVPDRAVGEHIAEALVQEQLAACTHVRGPIESRYWWQGRMEIAQEWEVDAVTSSAAVIRCADRIRELHPYELSAVLISTSTASAEYAVWVQQHSG
jgi:periplasmic divalent cation tolerance protein